MNRYKLTFDKTTSVFIVMYKNGQFASLTYKRGGLSEQHFKYVSQVIPVNETGIAQVMKDYDNRVKFDKMSDDAVDSLFAKCMRIYCHFYEKETSLSPKIDGIEGKALKQIVSYLFKETASEEESAIVWSQLLSNWYKQEEFYRKQMLIRQINSNLPILLTQLKQHATGKTQSNRDANDVRESL